MILNLSIPDELYTRYAQWKGFHRPHMAMQETLKRFADQDPSDARAFVVNGAQRDELEKAAGGVSIESFDQLLGIVKNAAVLRLGEVEIPVPKDLLAYYLGNAEFLGREPGEHIRGTVVELLRRGAGA